MEEEEKKKTSLDSTSQIFLFLLCLCMSISLSPISFLTPKSMIRLLLKSEKIAQKISIIVNVFNEIFPSKSRLEMV